MGHRRRPVSVRGHDDGCGAGGLDLSGTGRQACWGGSLWERTTHGGWASTACAEALRDVCRAGDVNRGIWGRLSARHS